MVTSPMPGGYPVGSSIHVPIKLSTKVVPIYLLAVPAFELLGLQELEHMMVVHPILWQQLGRERKPANCPNLVSHGALDHCNEDDLIK